MHSIGQYLAQLHALGITLPSETIKIDSFGDSAELSEELIGLIKTGKKRAGASLLWAYEAKREDLPSVGDVNIVVDHRDQPVLITRTTDVQIIAFQNVTPAFAALEGEGDCSLQYWRKAHWDFFTRACIEIGRQPHESMPVVCCTFEVVQIIQ